MKRGMTEILAELGRRLAAFGESEVGSGSEGRSGGEVRRAAKNLALDMLSPEALSAWAGRYPDLPAAEPRNVLIVTAGNIPLVGVHDLVCVLAAGHRAIVKPSSKDRDNMSWVVRQLSDIEPALPVELLSDASPAPDAVIAMGSDDTVAAIARRYGGVPTLLRGHRSSLAILSGGESTDQLAALADDVVSFSGLGCRNVSLVFVPRDYDPGDLRDVLARREGSVGTVYRNNRRQVRAMLEMTGTPHVDCGVCMLVEKRDFPSQPTILHYARYDDPAEAWEWIRAHEAEIQCVALPAGLALPSGLVPAALHSRAVALGRTQRPRLDDYPDGRDTMLFLSSI